MTDDEMKRWLEEAKEVQAPRPSFSHARTKPIVVEKLKSTSRRPPDPRPKEQRTPDSEH
jgi:hypothetical protein